MVSASEILDIIEIIFFAPALPITIYICIRHGFKREAGWLLLTILSVIRLVGAICGIISTKDHSQTLIEISLIMSSTGSATLVAAFTGITNRIADGSKGSPLSPKQRKLLQIIGLASIVIGILGGTKVADSDPSTRSTGQTYIQVAVILILVQFLATSVVFGFCAINFRHVLDVDRKLFFCVALAIPFLFVRVLYSILAAFDPNSATFGLLSTTAVAVVVRACLGIAMEIISVTLFILAGLLSPKIATGTRSAETGTATQEYIQFKEQHSNPAVQYQDTVTR